MHAHHTVGSPVPAVEDHEGSAVLLDERLEESNVGSHNLKFVGED